MAKKVTGVVKLQIPAGAANPAPPVGPALHRGNLQKNEDCHGREKSKELSAPRHLSHEE